ncbi:MAG: polyamine aminopropyltransferase [Bdellovibrionales bacterium]|nr:polyamine aminopropyltransferase [Bdellovibrionales bacterium]
MNGCDPATLDDPTAIERAMVEAAELAGATLVSSSFHHFSPYGVSGVVVIQESHLAIHTWPEYGHAAIDLFTCGDTIDSERAFTHLERRLRAGSHSRLDLPRGSLASLTRNDFRPALLRKKERPVPRFDRSHWFTDRDANQALSLRTTGAPLFAEKSPHQFVRVFQSPAYGKFLALDGAIMVAERDEAHYHEMLVHPLAAVALARASKPLDVLVIGGGDGGALREVLRYPEVRRVVAVELDETVVRAVKAHFPRQSAAFADPRVELRIADGTRYVAEAPGASFDWILIDSADPQGPAEGLFGPEFFRECRRLLRDDGWIAAQGESPISHEAAFVGLHRCLRDLFGEGAAHVGLFHATTYPSGMWSVHLAGKTPFSPTEAFDPVRTARFARDQELHYYNEAIHRGTFALPNFVSRLLSRP